MQSDDVEPLPPSSPSHAQKVYQESSDDNDEEESYDTSSVDDDIDLVVGSPRSPRPVVTDAESNDLMVESPRADDNGPVAIGGDDDTSSINPDDFDISSDSASADIAGLDSDSGASDDW